MPVSRRKILIRFLTLFTLTALVTATVREQDGVAVIPRSLPSQIQDSGKSECSGCGCGFRLRTNAENSVMTSPIGKG